MTTWREQLAFAPLDSAERGDEIGKRLRRAIELGVLEDGTQLPSESELAGRMKVSTLTLRAALAELRQLGLIETRRGKGGGSFVRMDNTIDRRPAEALGDYRVEDLCDLREYHAFLAGAAAATAARRSGRIASGRLEEMAKLVQSADNPADMTRADSRFHLELAATSGSLRLAKEEMITQAEIGPLLWITGPERRLCAASDHIAIARAINAGLESQARSLAEAHVRNDLNFLIELRMAMEPTSNTNHDEVLNVGKIQAVAAAIYQAAESAVHQVEEAARTELGLRPGIDPDQMTMTYDAARKALLKASPVVFGVGFASNPTVYDHAGGVYSYTPTDPYSPQPLERDVEFYDYLTAPWWPKDATETAVQVSLPYLDVGGTDEHIMTFSKGIVLEGTLVGVVNASILIRQLQADFEPLLRPSPLCAAIVDDAGGVIVTNTASLIGGTRHLNGHQKNCIPLPAWRWQLCLEERQASPEQQFLFETSERMTSSAQEQRVQNH